MYNIWLILVYVCAAIAGYLNNVEIISNHKQLFKGIDGLFNDVTVANK